MGKLAGDPTHNVVTYAKEAEGLWEGIKGQEGRCPSSQPGGERGVEMGYGDEGGGGPQKLRQQQQCLGTHALGWGQCQLAV